MADEIVNGEESLVQRLRKRLERERRARIEAESIAETVTRELYALNRMKTEFIATVSHELRTPLTAIVGFTESLRRRELAQHQEIQREALEAIARNAERLQRIVNQLLSTSLFQTPDTEVRLGGFDFAEIAEAELSSRQRGKIALEVEIPQNLPSVVSDRMMVAQILSNLVDNAMKFSPDGGTVRIGAKVEGGVLRFWVQDEGIGMTPQEVEHVFEPFWQADTSLTRKFGGMGLGLHIARLITHILGGEITITSSPGRGSKFEVAIRSGAAGATRNAETA